MQHRTLVFIVLLILPLADAWGGEPRSFCQQPPPDGRLAAPVGVIAYFKDETVPALMEALRRHPELSGRPIYVGRFGATEESFRQTRALRRGCYAPIFSIEQYPTRYPDRRLSPSEAAELPASEQAYAGAFPAQLQDLPTDEVHHWGLELGRRMRDALRRIELGKVGIVFDAWQFNEFGPSTYQSTPEGTAHRFFLAGILEGIAFGRPQLGDSERRGIVFVGGPHALSALDPSTDGTGALLSALRRSSLRIAGEEYPKFVGDPRRTADWIYQHERSFPKWIQHRYLPLLTPGYMPWKVVGSSTTTTPTYTWGNVDGCSDAYVSAWRDAFAERRVRPKGQRARAAGVGMWAFVGPNAQPRALRSAVASLARGIGAILGARERKIARLPPCRSGAAGHARPNP